MNLKKPSPRLDAVRNVLVALLLAGLAACGQKAPEPPSPNNTPEPGKETPVTFTLEVSGEYFSPNAEIRVSIWDSTQLEIAQNNPECVVSLDASGKEETICPPGTTYRKPTPEEITFSYKDLEKPLRITSKSVMVGEMYRVTVGGTASDGCNTASAQVKSVASEETVLLKDLSFAQTEMACLPPR